MHALRYNPKRRKCVSDDLLYLRNGTEHLVQQRIGISIERQIKTPYIHSHALPSPQSRNLACGTRLSDARTDTTGTAASETRQEHGSSSARTVVHQQIKSRCFGNTYLFGQILGHEQITKSSMQCPVTKPDYFQFNAGLFRQCDGGKRGTDAVCQTSGRNKYHFSFHIAQK